MKCLTVPDSIRGGAGTVEATVTDSAVTIDNDGAVTLTTSGVWGLPLILSAATRLQLEGGTGSNATVTGDELTSVTINGEQTTLTLTANALTTLNTGNTLQTLIFFGTSLTTLNTGNTLQTLIFSGTSLTTLTLGSAVATVSIQVGAALTDLTIPDSVVDLAIFSAVAIDFILPVGAWNATTVSIIDAALDQTNVDAILDKLADNAVSNGTVNLSGGNSASPTLDAAAVAGNYDMNCGPGASFTSGADGDYVQLYRPNGFFVVVWFNVNSSCTQPSAGLGGAESFHEVNIASSDDSDAVAAATQPIVAGIAGFTADSPSGATIHITNTDAGNISDPINASPCGFSSVDRGADVSNSSVDALVGNAQRSIAGRGWTVTTN